MNASSPATRYASVDGLRGRLAAHIQESGLLLPHRRVLIAVSGGLDSIVLLHLFRFGHLADVELHAAHFDHRMREGSTDDAAWVRGVCRAWCVPLVEGHATQPLRSEDAARRARYAFLTAAAEVNGTAIVTAHQADDQIETVLFRLLRGSGFAGLAGIPARRGRIIRPLLPFHRNEIRGYAEQSGLAYREDPTNEDRRFTRNRIRHELLPALSAALPGAGDSLLRLARDARSVEQVLSKLTDEALDRVMIERSDDVVSLARTPLLGYHRLIRGRILRRAFETLGRAPGRAGTLAALSFIRKGASGRSILLAGGYRIEREFDRFVLRSTAAETAVDRPLVIREPGSGLGGARIGGRSLQVRWAHGFCAGTDDVSFDPTFLRFPLEFRSWRPGDRIRLHGGTRKLKKVFADRRVPRSARSQRPVLVDADGRIVWVDGVGRAAGAGPQPEGPAFLIRVTDGDDG